ncbi:hypothetical protein [Rhizobium leguminosarum]|uniref:hypothetical protein n=1 Tax=Rhizobium leguminosarum TaxID=384 RepID=UPI0015DAFC3D|nr:hypothetical protein [Rhizobium leguminosarum]NZD50564.1 hypothetical protein [Rhizobium leguminosarum]
MDKTIVVRHFGVASKTEDGYVPHTVIELISALQDALSDIPPQYRATADVDISEDPDPYDGCGYDSLRVTYSRPMTEREQEEYARSRRADLLSEIIDYERLANDRRAELASLS